MADILCFSRNRATSVEQLDARTVLARCHLQDSLMEAFVEITAILPDLEITRATGAIRRPVEKAAIDVNKALRGIIGTRIGPGIRKIIREGLADQSPAEKQLCFMLEECCEGVILTYTKAVLLNAPKDRLREREYFKKMVSDNPRLYNSCAALAPGSPLVAGIAPPRTHRRT